MAIGNTNDGSNAKPYLRRDLNWATLWALPQWSEGPRGDPVSVLPAVKAAGYAGVQHVDAEAVLAAGLRATGMGRVLSASEVLPLARDHRARGFDCTTLHVGTGLETDLEMDRLADAVVGASAATGYRLYVETHRATMTQDMRRTVDLVARFPDLRFNADLSHWYTGQEMTYGDFDAKLAFIAPVLSRVRFLHGRIGTSGCIQVPIGAGAPEGPHIDHFRTLWQACFAGFLQSAGAGDYLVFASELLPARVSDGSRMHHLGYAREVLRAEGRVDEESDRWTEADLLWRLASSVFDECVNLNRLVLVTHLSS